MPCSYFLWVKKVKIKMSTQLRNATLTCKIYPFYRHTRFMCIEIQLIIRLKTQITVKMEDTAFINYRNLRRLVHFCILHTPCKALILNFLKHLRRTADPTNRSESDLGALSVYPLLYPSVCAPFVIYGGEVCRPIWHNDMQSKSLSCPFMCIPNVISHTL